MEPYLSPKVHFRKHIRRNPTNKLQSLCIRLMSDDIGFVEKSDSSEDACNGRGAPFSNLFKGGSLGGAHSSLKQY